MNFIKGKADFINDNVCSYLLCNGLGGFSSALITGENARNEHGVFIGAVTAPIKRVKFIDSLDEVVIIGGVAHRLCNQRYVSYTKNSTMMHEYVSTFNFKEVARWNFDINGVSVTKILAFKYLENTLAVKYVIDNFTKNTVQLQLTPTYSFVDLGMVNNDQFNCELVSGKLKVVSNGYDLVINVNDFDVREITPVICDDHYYQQDAVDGRNCVGKTTQLHQLVLEVPTMEKVTTGLVVSTTDNDDDFEQIIKDEVLRRESLYNVEDGPIEVALKLGSDQFIVNRESTNGKTIIAGYPFFGDWGRDTMFALLGGCLSTGRYDDAVSMFKTFSYYLKDGLIPNLFPTSNLNEASFYNSVDAPLLFIWAMYEYYDKTNDLSFIKEDGIKIIEDIIDNYISGTSFSIKVDPVDGMVSAGGGYDQVTWMDVRFGDVLPTPRHGKPVEINGFWYNALSICEFFSECLGTEFKYASLKKQVSDNFVKMFYNEKEQCLFDVVSGELYDQQIRSNQIWVVTIPFSPLTKEISKEVVDCVYRNLFTTHGLRSLAPQDEQFTACYGGSHFNRDMAYHQGTVWTFPLGGFYIAHLKVYEDQAFVLERLDAFTSILNEGCIGQVAEIYDGLSPTQSRGCYAQAWSVSEILRVYEFLK